jgi:hypothetical protein
MPQGTSSHVGAVVAKKNVFDHLLILAGRRLTEM